MSSVGISCTTRRAVSGCCLPWSFDGESNFQCILPKVQLPVLSDLTPACTSGNAWQCLLRCLWPPVPCLLHAMLPEGVAHT